MAVESMESWALLQAQSSGGETALKINNFGFINTVRHHPGEQQEVC